MKQNNLFLFLLATIAMPYLLKAQTVKDYKYYDSLGIDYLTKDSARQSLSIFDTAVMLSSNNKDVFLDRARAKVKSGLYASGLRDYDSAILYADKTEQIKYIEKKEEALTGHADIKFIVCDKFSETFGTLVPQLRVRELYSEAELFDIFDKTVSLFPDSASVYVDRSNYYFKKMKFEEAIPDLKKAIELDPSPLNYYHLACLMYYSRNYGDRKIEKQFETGIEKNPTNGWAYYYRAVYNAAYGLSNKTKFEHNKDSYDDKEAIRYYNKAVEDYSKAIELNATAAWYIERARCKQNSRSYSDDQIMNDYNMAVVMYPPDKKWIGHSIRADYYMSNFHYKQAIEDLDAAIASGKASAFDYLKRAKLKDKYGGFTNQEIIADLDKAKLMLHGKPMGALYESLYLKLH